MSFADELFVQTIEDILDHGVSDEGRHVRPHWADGTPAHTIALFGVVHRYDLSKEVPIMTLRRTYWKSAWKELAWIWLKKSNRVADVGSHVWDAWADENGTIGKAYGYQMGEKARYKDVTAEGIQKAFGGTPEEKKIVQDENGIYLLDQTDRIIYQLVNDPASRRIMSNIYHIDELADMALAPCAYSMTFMVTGNKLNAILNQRSQDMLAANNWNTMQYALLVYALASAYGFEPGEFVHCIANCHIYDRHIPIVKELIKKPQHAAPKLTVDPTIHDLYQFTANSFAMEGYVYNDFDTKFEVAI